LLAVDGQDASGVSPLRRSIKQVTVTVLGNTSDCTTDRWDHCTVRNPRPTLFLLQPPLYRIVTILESRDQGDREQTSEQ